VCLRYRPTLEALEDRAVPALLFVTTLGDSNPSAGGAASGGGGDLRYALTTANGIGGSNTIEFAPGLEGIISLAAPLPAIDGSLNLLGPRGGAVIVDGDGYGSVVRINPGATVSITDLTIAGGNAGAAGDGGIAGAAGNGGNAGVAGDGGDGGPRGSGIANRGTLTVTDCTITGNAAAAGGGIWNAGTLTVADCTISDNSAPIAANAAAAGGGIWNAGTLTVADCTISDNSAPIGGGLFNEGTATIMTSTVADNNSSNVAGAIDNEGTLAISSSTLTGNSASTLAGGILATGSTTLHDTIDAGNRGLYPDCYGTVTSAGYNLVGDTTGSSGWQSTDLTGTPYYPVQPLLGPLQNNGGPTFTCAALPGSPALNAGDPQPADRTEFDQRGPGFARLVGTRIDIGAVEYQTAITLPPAAVAPVGSASLNAPIGTTYATLLQVKVTDRLGNPLAGQMVAFATPVSGPSGTFDASGIVITDGQGVATAPAFTANHVTGMFTVTATVAGVATPASFHLCNTLVPAAITAKAGSGQKAAVTSTYHNLLQVLVTDAHGAPVRGITVVFELPGPGAGGTFAGSAAVVTNAAGLATAPPLSANTSAGVFAVTAWVAGVASPAKFTLTNTAGAAVSIDVHSGSGQSAAVGKTYANRLTAQVFDAFGNPVSGALVSFGATATGAGGAFAGKTSVTTSTNALGIATAPSFTANARPGTFTVTATIKAAGSSPATFTLTNLGAPAVVTVVGSAKLSASANGDFPALVVQVTDSAGDVLSGVVVTYTVLPNKGVGGSFGGTNRATATTDAKGQASAPTLKAGATAGTLKVQATIAGVPLPAVFGLTIT
jgi:hypothetical protein